MRRGSSSLRKVRFGRPVSASCVARCCSESWCSCARRSASRRCVKYPAAAWRGPARCPDRGRRSRTPRHARSSSPRMSCAGRPSAGWSLLAGGQRYRRVEDRRDVAASQLVERRADQALCLRIRVHHAPRSRVEQDDSGGRAIEDRAIAGFAGGCRRWKCGVAGGRCRRATRLRRC